MRVDLIRKFLRHRASLFLPVTNLSFGIERSRSIFMPSAARSFLPKPFTFAYRIFMNHNASCVFYRVTNDRRVSSIGECGIECIVYTIVRNL